MEEEVRFPNKENEKLAGFLHKPKNETDKGIVLAHCFTCSRHQKIVRTLCDALAEKNFLVLRFDFSGNGDSEGEFEDSTYSKEIQDLTTAVDYISKKGIKKIAMLGHSMGATVSILQSSQDPRIKSLCVLAGQSNPKAIKELFPMQTLEKIYEEGQTSLTIFGKKVTIKREFFEDADKQDIKKSLNKFKNPFCIIHGDADTVIPIKSGKELYSYANEKKELKIIKGADHLFSGKDKFEEMKSSVIEWFEKTI